MDVEEIALEMLFGIPIDEVFEKLTMDFVESEPVEIGNEIFDFDIDEELAREGIVI